MNTLLEDEFDSLDELINIRLLSLKSSINNPTEFILKKPKFYKNDRYASLVDQLTQDERLTLILALASYFAAEKLDPLYFINPAIGSCFSQIGGQTNRNPSAFLPTGDTARFLCCGSSFKKAIGFQKILMQTLHSIKTTF